MVSQRFGLLLGIAWHVLVRYIVHADDEHPVIPDGNLTMTGLPLKKIVLCAKATSNHYHHPPSSQMFEQLVNQLINQLAASTAKNMALVGGRWHLASPFPLGPGIPISPWTSFGLKTGRRLRGSSGGGRFSVSFNAKTRKEGVMVSGITLLGRLLSRFLYPSASLVGV